MRNLSKSSGFCSSPTGRFISATILNSVLGLSAIGSAWADVSSSIEPVLNDHSQIQYGSSISPDASAMYFSQAAADFSDRYVMKAVLRNGKATTLTKVLMGGKPVSGGDTQISPDGNTLVFYSREAFHREASRKDGDLFYASKTPHGWSAPTRFPETINSDLNEFYPVLTNSGNLYFARENPGTSYDLYVSEYADGKYQLAKKLNQNINTSLLESDAYITPDESFMVFVRMYEEGAYGVSDLYISFNRDGDWSKPVNLGKQVNFAGVDGSPFVTQDKKWLYFTSNRDAPEPTKFDSHLGVFRVPFAALLKTLSSQSDLVRIYKDVDTISPYFAHGKVIFNTSMPDDGSAHFFTDNRGFEWGPTAIYQRTSDGDLELLELKGAKIPADVHISPDGKTLYFVDYGVNPSRIFVSTREGGKWLPPTLDERLPESSGYLTSTQQGVVYFSKDGDVFRLENNEISKLPDTVNTQEGERDPFIAQDESFLIIVREDAIGDSNMYISLRNESGWTIAEKLPAPFNAEKVDGSPYVTPDKKYLFFSSNRGGDVLQTWQAPFAEFLKTKGL